MCDGPPPETRLTQRHFSFAFLLLLCSLKGNVEPHYPRGFRSQITRRFRIDPLCNAATVQRQVQRGG